MTNRLLTLKFITFAVLLMPAAVEAAEKPGNAPSQIRKIEDIVIYQNEKFYSAFPSAVRRPDGELLVAFRRAPNRRLLGEKGHTHTDANSQLVLVRSKDAAQTWTEEPGLIFAHPFGGSQDPCMVQLRDGTIVCSSYGWAWLQTAVAERMTNSLRHGNFMFMGGYLLRSTDGGHSWQDLVVPPPVQGEATCDFLGQPTAAYNRGPMCQVKDGRLFWVVASNILFPKRKTATHLLVSSDNGAIWNYSCPVAHDDKITFNETALYETAKGDLVAFMRTANFDDHTAVARSTDGGRSFGTWQDAGFQGHPHFALRLPDGRVLLVYGYRHKPYGIRARVLNTDCTDLASAREIILRDDGGGTDLGYPWAAMISKNRVLVVYYFNQDDGLRHIAGTVLAVE